ncbi:hypothetical protein V5799_000637 [Amblyomma americanum]|uniref:Uncharacterized protein n=1 Tax=Amblyomma americanum TaxID=6943 RepID=A0AAQ4D2G6_AMBAM
MHKEHLKCDYVPFCILGVLAVIVITLVYLYAYRPVRNLLGLNKREEEKEEAGSLGGLLQNSSSPQDGTARQGRTVKATVWAATNTSNAD